MGLDDGLGDAHQGGAPHLVGVHQLFKALQPAGHQQGGQLCDKAFLKHPLHLPGQKNPGALHSLEEDISGIAVGYNHVHRALYRFPGLHVAHEVDAPGLSRRLQHGVDGGLQGGALGGLRADVQQSHLGTGTAQHLLGVVGAHIGELE